MLFQKYEYTKLIRFNKPIVIKMNGYKQKGIIFKPGGKIG